jgi:CDP-diacylglycerol--serine O-phosphatidyltransferase
MKRKRDWDNLYRKRGLYSLIILNLSAKTLNLNLQWTLKHIPNSITLLNLLWMHCNGLVTNSDFGFYFVCPEFFLDFLMGFFARLLKVSGPLGLQLIPWLIWLLVAWYLAMWCFLCFQIASMRFLLAQCSLPRFIITMGSCYRLAVFNIDTRQTNLSLVLPTPANALFILSLPWY